MYRVKRHVVWSFRRVFHTQLCNNHDTSARVVALSRCSIPTRCWIVSSEMTMSTMARTYPDSYSHGKLHVSVCTALILVYLGLIALIPRPAPFLKAASVMACLQLAVYLSLFTLDTSCPPVLQAVVMLGALAWCVLITALIVHFSHPHTLPQHSVVPLQPILLVYIFVVVALNGYAGWLAWLGLEKFADTRTCYPHWIPRVPRVRAIISWITIAALVPGILRLFRNSTQTYPIRTFMAWSFMLVIIFTESMMSMHQTLGWDVKMAAWVVALFLDIAVATLCIRCDQHAQ